MNRELSGYASPLRHFSRRRVRKGRIRLHDITIVVIYKNRLDRIASGEEAPKGCLCIKDVGTSTELSLVENSETIRFIILGLPKYADLEMIWRPCLDLITVGGFKIQSVTGYVLVVGHSAMSAKHSIAAPKLST